MTSSKTPDYPDDNAGIVRYTRHNGRRTPSGPLRPIRRMEPQRPPGGYPGPVQGIPRAPSIRNPQDVADIETAQLPPAAYPRRISHDMMPARFYVDETVMLQQAKLEIERIEQMNQRLRTPYEIGTEAGIYTDCLEIDSVHYIREATENLIKARRRKQAYHERHAQDDPPEGA